MGLQRPADRDATGRPGELGDSLSELPEARLVRTADPVREILSGDEPPPRIPVSAATSAAPLAVVYPEWDWRTGDYRLHGAVVREAPVPERDVAWSDGMVQRHGARIRRVRREWGYGAGERLDPEALLAGRYRGIRPAFGYPACPDHAEKFTLFDLLGARALGMDLTESGAMLPAATVSGLYFSQPRARYFTVGRLGRDQVEAYASRKGTSPEAVERWLGPYLAYELAPTS